MIPLETDTDGALVELMLYSPYAPHLNRQEERMPQLTKKQMAEIANAILDNSEFAYTNANLRHLRKTVREMMIEMAVKVLEKADESK